MPVVPGPDPSSGGQGAGPCEQYASVGALQACIPDLTPELAADLIAESTLILWALLSRSITGVCEATVFTDETCWPLPTWLPYPQSAFDYGRIDRVDRDRIELQRPVVAITEVIERGLLLDPSQYAIMDDGFLVRQDGCYWLNGVEITYSFGFTIPDYVTDAALELAVEIWKDRCGLESCIPRNVSSLSRQGISMTFDQRVDQVREAGPVLGKVAVAMAVANPTNQRMPSEVWSADTPHRLHSFR